MRSQPRLSADLAQTGVVGPPLQSGYSTLSASRSSALAQCLLETGDAPGAVEAATAALRRRPEWAVAYLTLARAQLNAGAFGAATRSFRDAVARDEVLGGLHHVVNLLLAELSHRLDHGGALLLVGNLEKLLLRLLLGDGEILGESIGERGEVGGAQPRDLAKAGSEPAGASSSRL